MPAGRSRSAVTHWAAQGRCWPYLATGCLLKSRSSELRGGSQVPHGWKVQGKVASSTNHPCPLLADPLKSTPLGGRSRGSP